jgi:xanthine dehydrogenase accessory factor
VGLALARIAVRSGYEVIVVDDRPEFTREATLVGARGITTRPDDPALREQVTDRTAVTVLTRSHALDRESLLNVLDTPAFYLGMIGSRRKVDGEMESLREAGTDPALLDRVHAPIGLDIGAETPAEIAVSILAEIVAVRRTGRTPEGSLAARSRS